MMSATFNDPGVDQPPPFEPKMPDFIDRFVKRGWIDRNDLGFVDRFWSGGPGGDLFDGDGRVELAAGFGGDDRLDGGAGLDLLFGGRGKDRLYGGLGDDTLRGGDGADVLDGGLGDDLIVGGGQADLAYGGIGRDTLIGNGGADDLNGGGGDDVLIGGRGRDRLDGGLGDDVLTGGRGADLLYGGPGSDVFVFKSEPGQDRILDFDVAEDLLEIGIEGAEFEDVSIAYSASGAVVSIDDVHVTLHGVADGDLDEAHFLF